MKAKIIVLANRKGGVGKTTMAHNLSSVLVERGKLVLMIDIDSQGNLTSVVRSQVSDLETFKSVQTVQIRENLWLLRATKEFGNLEAEMNERFDRNEYFREELLPKIEAAGIPWDFIVIDTPPSLSLLPVNAFIMADLVVVPVNGDNFSLDGYSEVKKILSLVKKRNDGLKFKVVVNKYDSRLALTKEIVNKLASEAAWGNVLIPDREYVNQSNTLKSNALGLAEVRAAFEQLAEVVHG